MKSASLEAQGVEIRRGGQWDIKGGGLSALLGPLLWVTEIPGCLVLFWGLGKSGWLSPTLLTDSTYVLSPGLRRRKADSGWQLEAVALGIPFS